MAVVREADGTRAPGGNDDELVEEVSRLVASVSAEDAVALLGVFKQERGQQDLAVEGVRATLAALAAARVDTLLIHDDPEDSRTAWFSAGATGATAGMVAPDARTLRELGIEDIEEGRLVDVAIRAAFKSGASVRVIPSVHSMAEGIGAVLRF
jgi:peptide subunit release factor 1 (eRF1)